MFKGLSDRLFDLGSRLWCEENMLRNLLRSLSVRLRGTKNPNRFYNTAN